MSRNQEKQYTADVIVIGAGFAGVTVARELSQRGKSVLILEARDRIGGRTLTEKNGFDQGEILELGGVWVHWLQPHVWAEITRYGLELHVCEDLNKVLWFADNKLHSGSPEEFDELIAPSMDAFVKDALVLFPTPDQPLAFMANALKEADKLSIKDKIDQINCPSDMIKELLDGFWSINFNSPSEQGAYTQAMRWIARAGGNWRFAFESCGQYKIKNGTFALLKSMFDDAAAHTTLHLNAVVTHVSQTDNCANVQLSDGRQYSARYVVVTVPINVLNHIKFSPPLNILKQEAAANGQASRGVKLFIFVRGVPSEPFCAYASGKYAINYLQTECYPKFNNKSSTDTSILLAFGPDANRINAFDKEAVTRELRRWLPDVEVLEVMHHNWSKDPFSGETWPMLKPGQLTTYLSALQESHKRVHFAGSDYAAFYAGSIDGAIESGMRAARLIVNELDKLS